MGAVRTSVVYVVVSVTVTSAVVRTVVVAVRGTGSVAVPVVVVRFLSEVLRIPLIAVLSGPAVVAGIAVSAGCGRPVGPALVLTPMFAGRAWLVGRFGRSVLALPGLAVVTSACINRRSAECSAQKN